MTLLPPAGPSLSSELEPSYGITYCTRSLTEKQRMFVREKNQKSRITFLAVVSNTLQYAFVKKMYYDYWCVPIGRQLSK